MLIFFLIFAQNIDCGYTLEPPRRGGSNEYPQSIFLSKDIENIKFFLVKFSIFTAEKNLCILHGQVFVMENLKINQNRTALEQSVKKLLWSSDIIHVISLYFGGISLFLSKSHYLEFQYFPIL